VEEAKVRTVIGSGREIVEVLGKVIHRRVAAIIHFVNDMRGPGENNGVTADRFVLTTLEHISDTTILPRLPRLGDREQRRVSDNINRVTEGINCWAKDTQSHQFINKFFRHFQFVCIHGGIRENLVTGFGEEVHGPA
jgi:hypothetical protein